MKFVFYFDILDLYYSKYAYSGIEGYGIRDANDSSRYILECKRTKLKISKLIIINVDQKNTESIANLFRMNEVIIDEASRNITALTFKPASRPRRLQSYSAYRKLLSTPCLTSTDSSTSGLCRTVRVGDIL